MGALVVFALFLSVIAAIAACSGSSSDSVRPTTGILIRAETLTTGRGCGRSPTQLYKYAVIVFGYGGSGDPSLRANYTSPLTSNVFDCFTDGAFIELPQVNGNTSFRLEVFAYNEPAYAASRDAIEFAGTNTKALKDSTTPTWTTECTASQQQDVQTLAVCDPLAAGTSGLGGPTPLTEITFGTSTFRLADGRSANCNGDAGTPATPDAAADAGGGPSDAALDGDALIGLDAQTDGAVADAALDSGGVPVDAGPPISFSTVRIRYRTSVFVGPTVDLACPSTYRSAVPAEPARYDIDVGLLDQAGTPVGQALCTVTTQTGSLSTAICP